jgi:hypothetical protein
LEVKEPARETFTLEDHEEVGDWDQGICSHETDSTAENGGEGAGGQGTCSHETGTVEDHEDAGGQGTCSQETRSVEVTRRLEVKETYFVSRFCFL